MTQSLIIEVLDNATPRQREMVDTIQKYGPGDYHAMIFASEHLWRLRGLIRESIARPRFNYVVFDGKSAAETLSYVGHALEGFAREIIDINNFPLVRIFGQTDEEGEQRIKGAFAAPWTLQFVDMSKRDTNDNKTLAHHIHRIHRHRRRIEHITGNHSSRIEHITG